MIEPTLGALLEQRDLHLRLVAPVPRARLDAELRWAHSSDLPDPSPFLDDHVALLTTGSQFDRTSAGEYVDRLVSRGVQALGFGTGVVMPTIPADLVAACERSGLPLFEVPYRTPFLAVSRACADAAAAQRSPGAVGRSRHSDRFRLRRCATIRCPPRSVSSLASSARGSGCSMPPAMLRSRAPAISRPRRARRSLMPSAACSMRVCPQPTRSRRADLIFRCRRSVAEVHCVVRWRSVGQTPTRRRARSSRRSWQWRGLRSSAPQTSPVGTRHYEPGCCAR